MFALPTLQASQNLARTTDALTHAHTRRKTVVSLRANPTETRLIALWHTGDRSRSEINLHFSAQSKYKSVAGMPKGGWRITLAANMEGK